MALNRRRAKLDSVSICSAHLRLDGSVGQAVQAERVLSGYFEGHQGRYDVFDPALSTNP
jgi:hypothetical protein